MRSTRLLAFTLALLSLVAPAGAAISEVSANADFSMTAATDTLINAMTLTPGAGDYLAVFTMHLECPAAAADELLTFSIYVGGAQITHTEREVTCEGSIDLARLPVALSAWITPTAGQAVEARYRVSANTHVAKFRTLALFPKAAADFQQDTNLGPQTISSGTDTLLTGADLTPGAGTYLLVFGTTAENVSVGSTTNRIYFSVYVNGVQVAHTARRYMVEASISALLGETNVLIACKVTPTAGQVVDVRSRRDGTTNWTVKERTLTLMKVDDADIKEASQTADEADVGVAPELLVGMTLTDPGAAAWLALFSSSQLYTTTPATETASYWFYNAGAQDAESQRNVAHEASIDAADYFSFTSGVFTVAGATDDIELRWQGSSATSRTAHERTLVAVKEAGGAPPACTLFITLLGVGCK